MSSVRWRFFDLLGARDWRGLARIPLLPLAAGLWLGCAFPAPSPGWLVLPAMLGLLGRRPATAVPGQLLLGLLLGSLLNAAKPPTICPDPDGGKTTQWIGRVLSIEPARNDRASLLLDLMTGRRDGQDTSLRCRVLVSVGRRLPEILAGDLVWLPAADLEPRLTS